MERRKALLFATLVLSGALLAGCGEEEPVEETSTSTEAAVEDEELADPANSTMDTPTRAENESGTGASSEAGGDGGDGAQTEDERTP